MSKQDDGDKHKWIVDIVLISVLSFTLIIGHFINSIIGIVSLLR